MTSIRQRQLEILNQKFQLVKFAYDNLNISKGNYWEKLEGNRRRINGVQLAKQNLEIQFFSEGFFYQVKSFLDSFIKFLVGKRYTFKFVKNKKRKSDIYFNRNVLVKISPQTQYILDLIGYWDNGLTRKKYSLKVFNKYRNVCTHESCLCWANGQINSNKFKDYILPDSLNSTKPKYNKNINLYELSINTFDILNEMITKFDKSTRYKIKN